MAEDSEQRIAELEAEIATLKDALAAQQESSPKKYVDLEKIKNAVDASSQKVIEAIKPILAKYEEPGRAAAAKVGGKVSENPFLSVVVAFGAGIMIGKLLDLCCRGCGEEEE